MTWVLHTFDDLVFKRELITKQRVAIYNFVNSYGVRVEETVDGFDVIVLKNGVVCTNTHLNHNNMKSLTSVEVSDYMKIIQRFGRQTW
tara:strand:- start:82 stop:345 length:264 start_codon:yes stop_codon:yes gene_type:complete